MDLASAINRVGKQEVIVKSIIFNTIIDIFKSKTNTPGKKSSGGIDITSYLVSIKIKGNNILIKTNKPIINTELYNFSEEIKKVSLLKIKKLGFNYKEFELKFL